MDEDFEDDDDDDLSEPPRAGRQSQGRRQRRDYGSSYEAEGDYDDYDDDDDDNMEQENEQRVQEDYDNSDNNYISRTRPVEWEEIQIPNLRSSAFDFDGDEDAPSGSSTAYVLLPPSPPTMHPLPSAVLHFVGGTVFGSAPKAFYKSLLEDIVTHTQCAIVVTPLPVITPWNQRQNRGPLHHVQMAKNLQHQFQYAFEQVLDDEYGKDAMKSVPIAGMGHSLGSRLLVVLATLMKDEEHVSKGDNEENTNGDAPKNRQRSSRRDSADAPSYRYKSMILVSFTNFGADAGIPGVTSLLKQRRQIDEKNSNSSDRRPREEAPRRKQQDRRGRPPRRGDSRYDDDDDEDLMEEWGELWSEFQGIFQNQADAVKTRLTPQAEDLEFYPTPRQLWAAVEGDADKGQHGRYNIPQTLLVQFDRDEMDQSAKLATAMVASSVSVNAKTESTTISASNSTSIDGSGNTATATATVTTTTAKAKPMLDLKFARLRGTHLTPVTTSSSQKIDDKMINGYYSSSSSSSSGGSKGRGLLREWSSKSTKAVWNAIQGRVVGGKAEGGNMSQDEADRKSVV